MSGKSAAAEAFQDFDDKPVDESKAEPGSDETTETSEQSDSDLQPNPDAELTLEEEMALEEIDLEKIDLEEIAREIALEETEEDEIAGEKWAEAPLGEYRIQVEKHAEYHSLNAIQGHFRHIGKIPLQSHEEEEQLGGELLLARERLTWITRLKMLEVMEHGDPILGVKEKPARISRKRNLRYEYLKAEQSVRALEHKLALHNLRLVVYLARKNMFRTKRLQMMDLIQEGNIGNQRAAKGFDPERGYKYSTYAGWWIRQTINRAISDKDKEIRIPVHMSYSSLARYKTVEALKKEKNFDPDYEPGPEEIAEVMGITVEKVRKLEEVGQEPLSLHNPVPGGDGTLFIDITLDEKSPGTDDGAVRGSDGEYLDELFKALTAKERYVVRERYGIGREGREAGGKTLKEISDEIGVSRERIRQIEKKAKEKLRKAATRLETPAERDAL